MPIKKQVLHIFLPLITGLILLINLLPNLIYLQIVTSWEDQSSFKNSYLGEELNISNFNSTSPLTFLKRVEALPQIIKFYKSEQNHFNKERKVAETFDKEVGAFNARLNKLPEDSRLHISSNSLKSINIEIKREPGKYIEILKLLARDQIIEHNKVNEVIRYSFDPEYELSQMSLEEKVGQLFIFPISGTTLSIQDHEFLESNHIGSVILFGENVVDETQLLALTSQIQKLSPKLPMFIAIDQEGGTVKRIKWDSVGGARDIAVLTKEEQCDNFKLRAELLNELGINWNFGYVADVTSDPNSFIYSRTFAGDYAKSVEIITTAIKCGTNSLNTVKHWPGHGATSVDTHTNLGVLSNPSLTNWEETDNLPFRKASENSIDAIMLGHLILPALDSSTPASLSKRSVEYLRSNMQYEGLIVTDDLRMLTTSGISLQTSVKQSLLAGSDILIVVIKDDALKSSLINEVVTMVQTGELTQSELDAHVVRILKAKSKIVKFNEHLDLNQ